MKPRQWDVCRVVGRRQGSVDLAVILQHDAIRDFGMRAVAPLVPAGAAAPVDKLTPKVEVEGRSYLVAVHLLTTIPVASLGQPIASLADREYDLKRAIDALFFFGF